MTGQEYSEKLDTIHDNVQVAVEATREKAKNSTIMQAQLAKAEQELVEQTSTKLTELIQKFTDELATLIEDAVSE